MALLDHRNVEKSGKPHMVQGVASTSNYRVIRLPPRPVRVNIGPALAADGLSASGTLRITTGKAGTLVDNTALPAVADDANRWFVGENGSVSFVVTGEVGDLGINHSIASGYTQISYEPAVGS